MTRGVGPISRFVDRLARAANVHWHWSNDNELPGNRVGSALKRGRAWFNFGGDEAMSTPFSATLGVEWVHGKLTTHALIKFDHDDREVTVGLALPGFSYWVSLGGLPARLFEILPMGYRCRVYSRGPRSIGVRVFDWALWWSLWENDHEGSSRDPWWMHGSLHVLDRLLGEGTWSSAVVGECDVLIPLPERSYPARVTLRVSTHSRPRWPLWPVLSERAMADIEVAGGIPVPGKGENSWDCDDDAVYSISRSARTVAQAVAGAVESVLETRIRHGGLAWAPPAVPPVMVEEVTHAQAVELISESDG